jgi:hypothetical protein
MLPLFNHAFSEGVEQPRRQLDHTPKCQMMRHIGEAMGNLVLRRMAAHLEGNNREIIAGGGQPVPIPYWDSQKFLKIARKEAAAVGMTVEQVEGISTDEFKEALAQWCGPLVSAPGAAPQRR